MARRALRSVRQMAGITACREDGCGVARARKNVAMRGFTLIELVTVLVVGSILAVVVMPRFFSTSSFAAVGFAAEVRAGLRHAQAVAFASGCDIRASLTATAFTLERWVGGTSCNDHTGTLTTLSRTGGGSYLAAVPANVAITSGALYFDTLGRPYSAATGLALSATLVLGIGSEQASVYPETGLVK